MNWAEMHELKACLDEADVFSVLPEALTAHVEAVLADQTVAVGTNSAGKQNKTGQNRNACKFTVTY